MGGTGVRDGKSSSLQRRIGWKGERALGSGIERREEEISVVNCITNLKKNKTKQKHKNCNEKVLRTKPGSNICLWSIH